MQKVKKNYISFAVSLFLSYTNNTGKVDSIPKKESTGHSIMWGIQSPQWQKIVTRVQKGRGESQ